jgi:hypothetical protein
VSAHLVGRKRGTEAPRPTFFFCLALALQALWVSSEREVRIVAIPGTEEAAKFAAKEYPAEFDATLPLPEIKTRPGTGKRYVSLFDESGTALPIKLVIVGPGDHQQERAQLARSKLSGAPVTISLVS